MKSETLCVGCMEDDSGAPVCPRCGSAFHLAAKSAMELKPRTILHEQYLIGRALGDGGFGITYLAWDLGLEIKVAVKEYMPSGVAGRSNSETKVMAYSEQSKQEFEWGLERFMEEARVLKKFANHPGIVAVNTVFRENGTAYLVMEFLDGVTFEEFLARRGGRIAFDTAMRCLMPAMEALTAVHAEGILHRDISPDNIYLTRVGKVKLIDFGAARNALSQKSRNLSIILKEGYAPEEQYRASGIQGPWTDVYAMAATMYHAITGKIPQPALDRQAEDTLSWPSQSGVEMDPRAEAALMKGLAIKTADRFQSMEDFKAALSGNLDFAALTRPVSAQPVLAPVPPIVSHVPPVITPPVPVPMPGVAPQRTQPGAWAHAPGARWPWVVIPLAAILVFGAVALTVLLPKFLHPTTNTTSTTNTVSLTSTLSSSTSAGGGGTTSTTDSTTTPATDSGAGGTDSGTPASDTPSAENSGTGSEPAAGGEPAVESSPRYETLSTQASDYITNGSWDDAVTVLTQAVRLKPGNPRAYALLGEAYLYGVGNFAEAARQYRNAIARGGEVVFHVNHDHHGGNFSDVCEGRLRISRSKVSFVGLDGLHKFSSRRSEIKEGKKNKFLGLFARGQADLKAFHIKLADGRNFNFAPRSNFSDAERELILSLIGKS